MQTANAGVLERLRHLFAPRSVALVGATDNSQWSVFTYANLRRYSPSVAIHVVHPRNEMVHGQKAVHSVNDIGQPVDLAYVMVPTAAVIEVVEEIADAGIKSLVILTAGFQEAGPEGKELSARLEKIAAERDLNVLGPNGNGFINVAAGVAPYGLPIAPPLVSGPVGIVLQSGGLAAAVLAGAQARGVGLSLMVSTGNEALISATDIMRYLVDDVHTKVIAAFLESVRHPEDFVDVAELALRAGKPIVALKVGRSEQGAKTALAHTGALAGDDRVIDAAFRQLGVVRVDSLEQMLATAGYLGYYAGVKGRRMAAVTPSGGACDLLADKAASEGLELPEFRPDTVNALREFLPPFSNPRNPLDVTGYVVVDPRLSLQALDVVARDAAGQYDMIVYSTSLPRVEPKDLKPIERRLDALAAARQRIPIPVILQTSVESDVAPYAQTMLDERGMHLVGGIDLGIGAIGHGVRYHERRDRFLRRPQVERRSVATPPAGAQGVWAEHLARDLLQSNGIPVVPAVLATTPDDAEVVASNYRGRVAMKIASSGLTHKSDIGGVRLDVEAGEAAIVFGEMMAAIAGAEGVLVSPMRRGGIELLVGIVTDPAWGKVLSIGLGGVWVEVMGDFALRILPVNDADVMEMLFELKGAAILRGSRGSRPADLNRLSEVIAAVADLAEALPVSALEINPLRVHGGEIEALDALVVWDKEV